MCGDNDKSMISLANREISSRAESKIGILLTWLYFSTKLVRLLNVSISWEQFACAGESRNRWHAGKLWSGPSGAFSTEVSAAAETLTSTRLRITSIVAMLLSRKEERIAYPCELWIYWAISGVLIGVVYLSTSKILSFSFQNTGKIRFTLEMLRLFWTMQGRPFGSR